MLAQAGADSVLGIEANPHAYLKCLIIKEIMEGKTRKKRLRTGYELVTLKRNRVTVEPKSAN